jgi:hypothetical protein
MDSFGLGEDDAESLAIETVRAERGLFKTLTEILFGAEIHKVGGFDQSVYTLLDRYWELISIESARERPQPATIGASEAAQGLIEEVALETEAGLPADLSESNSGEATTAPEQTDSDERIEVPGQSDDLAEPTWDDAFAETDQDRESADTGGRA